MNTLSSLLNWIGGVLGANPNTLATENKTIVGAINELCPDGAGAHNSTYRGKNLGSSVTADQWAAIGNGTFKDLYIGDYWTINSVVWRIAAFDYWYRTGDTECTTHHVVIVPDTTLYSAAMNDTSTTSGGYVNSKMYGTNLASAITTIESAFGASHILEHRSRLSNAVTNGYESGSAFYSRKVDLMSEPMVFGGREYRNASSGTAIAAINTIDNAQLPLFSLDHSKICCRSYWCLRDVASSALFCSVNNDGSSGVSFAGDSNGVRPAFAIMA